MILRSLLVLLLLALLGGGLALLKYQQIQDTMAQLSQPPPPSRSDNFEKAIGLARFAEHHGHLFGRIQLLRKDSNGHFQRLEMNDSSICKQVLLVTSNPQLDALFDAHGQVC